MKDANQWKDRYVPQLFSAQQITAKNRIKIVNQSDNK